MKNTLFSFFAAIALLAPASTAQFDVNLTGRVLRAPADACHPDATHRIDCTDVLLRSDLVDLGALEGSTVALTGGQVSQSDCVLIDVATAVPATEQTFQIAPFGFRLGQPIVITTVSPIGSLVIYFWSCGSGFVPLGEFGTYMLSLSETIVGQTFISIGVTIRTEVIPNNPSLVGATIHYQTAFVSLVGGLRVGLLNPNCFTIRN